MSYFQFHTSLPIYYMSSSRNFLLRYAPDCTFSSRNMKNLPTVGGRTPPSHILPPLGRYAPSQRLRPQMFWLITPLLYTVCTRLHHFKLKSAKVPYGGREGGTHTLPPLGRNAPSQRFTPKCFGSLRHWW